MSAPTADRTGTAPPQRSYPTDEELLTRVLVPYKAHCKYLKSALVTAGAGAGGGLDSPRRAASSRYRSPATSTTPAT